MSHKHHYKYLSSSKLSSDTCFTTSETDDSDIFVSHTSSNKCGKNNLYELIDSCVKQYSSSDYISLNSTCPNKNSSSSSSSSSNSTTTTSCSCCQDSTSTQTCSCCVGTTTTDTSTTTTSCQPNCVDESDLGKILKMLKVLNKEVCEQRIENCDQNDKLRALCERVECLEKLCKIVYKSTKHQTQCPPNDCELNDLKNRVASLESQNCYGYQNNCPNQLQALTDKLNKLEGSVTYLTRMHFSHGRTIR